jgi:hypothetical protein
LTTFYLGLNVDRATLVKKKEKGKNKADDEMQGDDEPGPGPVAKDKGREIFNTDPGLRWLKRQCK